MSRRRLAVASLSALALGALVSGVRAEPGPSLHLERLVPDRTLAFASLEDVGSWQARMKETAIAKLGADPEMQAFLKPIAEDVKKLTEGPPAGAHAPGGAPHGKGFPMPPMVMELLTHLQGLHGQASVALVDVVEGSGPVIAACLDFGDHLSDFTTFLTRVGEGAGKEGAKDAPPIATEQRDGKTWWSLGGGPGGKPMVSATSVGTALLVSTDPTWLQAVAASGGAPIASALSDSDAFKASRAGVGGDAVAAFVHANVPAILSRVKMQEKEGRIARALGLDTVRSASYGLAVRGDGFLESFVVDAPKADHGLVSLMQMTATDHRDLALAPSTAFVYCDGNPPLSTLLGKFRTLAGSVEPDAAAQIDKGLSEIKGRIGMDIETELLSGLSDRMTYWLGLPETGGLYPEFALILGVKDVKDFEPKMERAVNGLAAVLGQSEKVSAVQRTMEYHGHRLHLLDMASTRHGVVPFTPTWTMLGDRLVVTLVPHTMKEVLLRSEEGTGGSGGLAAQEDVRALLREAPEGFGSVSYFDLQSVLALLYDTGVPLLQTAVKSNLTKDIPVRLDWAALPPTRTLRPYFRSLAEFVTADEKGIRYSIHSPFPLLVPAMIIGATAGAFLGARRHEHFVRETTEASVVDVQMVEVSSAVELYMLANRKLPDSLADLVKPNPKTGEPILKSLPKDRWGHDLDIRRGGDSKSFQIVSAGPDGVWGTDDDIAFPPSGK